MLSGMAGNYKNNFQRKSTHDDYLMHMFDALQTVEHTDFADFVRTERRNFETKRLKQNYGPRDLTKAVREVYNTMVDRGDYIPEEHCKGKGKRATGSDKKTEPSKLLALMTNLMSMQKGGSSDNNNDNRGRDVALESFRYDKKGETAMFNNKTWWWCPKHKNSNGEMTGMYVRHRLSDHDVWQKDKKAYST